MVNEVEAGVDAKPPLSRKAVIGMWMLLGVFMLGLIAIFGVFIFQVGNNSDNVFGSTTGADFRITVIPSTLLGDTADSNVGDSQDTVESPSSRILSDRSERVLAVTPVPTISPAQALTLPALDGTTANFPADYGSATISVVAATVALRQDR